MHPLAIMRDVPHLGLPKMMIVSRVGCWYLLKVRRSDRFILIMSRDDLGLRKHGRQSVQYCIKLYVDVAKVIAVVWTCVSPA